MSPNAQPKEDVKELHALYKQFLQDMIADGNFTAEQKRDRLGRIYNYRDFEQWWSKRTDHKEKKQNESDFQRGYAATAKIAGAEKTAEQHEQPSRGSAQKF